MLRLSATTGVLVFLIAKTWKALVFFLVGGQITLAGAIPFLFDIVPEILIPIGVSAYTKPRVKSLKLACWLFSSAFFVILLHTAFGLFVPLKRFWIMIMSWSPVYFSGDLGSRTISYNDFFSFLLIHVVMIGTGCSLRWLLPKLYQVAGAIFARRADK